MTDPNFERSLRAAARRGRPGGVHPDASLLAAYVDRGLSEAERAELEAHVADCAECMERLALLGSVNVPEEPEAPSFDWSPRQFLSRWGWLVPVATVAVLVAVWERQPSTPAPSADSVAEKPAAVAAPPPASQPANRAVPADARKESDRSADARLEKEEAQKAPARQVAQGSRAKDTPATAQMQAREREAPSQFGAPLPGGSAAEEAVTPRDKKQLDAVSPAASDKLAAAQPAPPPAAATAPAQAESAAAGVAGRADEAKPRNEAAIKAKPMPESIAAGALLKSAVEGPVVLATRDAVSLRRLGTRLERSTDAGATWTLDLADAPGGLHAGACPTALVCWVGGSQGNVLVRQASGTWTRHVVADGRAAVVSIEATDALAATVRLSDGRGFRTSDGGGTWVEVVGSRQ
jgi:hypothetical protein